MARPVRHIKAESNHVCVIAGLANTDVVLSGEFTQIKFYQCRNVRVFPEQETIVVKGSGKLIQEALVSVMRSPDLQLNRFTISSAVSYESKAKWMDTVANGIVACPDSSGLDVVDTELSFVHYGIQSKSASALLQRVKVSRHSADACQFIGYQDVEIDGFDTELSLEVLPHDPVNGSTFIHRDAVQFSNSNGANSIIIRDFNCYYPDANQKADYQHNWKRWVKSADGIMVTEGSLNKFQIYNSSISSNNLNGVAFAIDPLQKYLDVKLSEAGLVH